MKRHSNNEALPQVPMERTHAMGGAQRLALCIVGAMLLYASWSPAGTQATEVRPAHNNTTKLSSTDDSDGDRVVDSRDMCPGTPEGWSVKHNGCPVYQKTGVQADANGVRLTGVTKIALNSDILFATASSRITAQGQSILNRFAEELKAVSPPLPDKREIRLAGYADLTGRWTANLALSQRRADAVRSHLIAQGIPAANIKAVGYGSAAPIVQCPDIGSRVELAACLAPNRRVEIEVRQPPDERL